MKMIAKGIRLTRKILQVIEDDEPEPHPGPISEPSDNIHDVYGDCFENPLYNDYNTIGVDLSGQYLDTSFDGHNYIYVTHDTITNYINS